MQRRRKRNKGIGKADLTRTLYHLPFDGAVERIRHKQMG